jgi:hypothetical protein
MYPVAVCYLHTFFEDVEAWSMIAPIDETLETGLVSLHPSHKSRLEKFAYKFSEKTEQHKAVLVYSKVGCLVSAVAKSARNELHRALAELSSIDTRLDQLSQA